MVYGEGNKADCPVCAIKNSYNDGVTDDLLFLVLLRRCSG